MTSADGDEETSTSRRRLLQAGGIAALALGAAGFGGSPGSIPGGSNTTEAETPTPTPVPADQRAIEYGETVQGTVDEGDDRDPEHDGLAEPVSASASAGDRIAVEAASQAFDARLVVTGPDGTLIDQSAIDERAQLELRLPTDGEYTIWVGSRDGSATGEYTLSLRQTGERADGEAIQYGTRTTGTVTGQHTDPVFGNVATPLDFEGSEGDEILALVVSDDLDPFLLLVGPDGSTVDVTENDGTNTTRIETVLPADGGYRLWVGTHDSARLGEYELTVEQTGTYAGGENLDTIAYGETREGEIDRSDRRDPVRYGVAEPVTFEGNRNDWIQLDLAAEAVDTHLVLVDEQGTAVATDDDSGAGTNSRIETVLPDDGIYTAWAGTYSGDDTGAYELSLAKHGAVPGSTRNLRAVQPGTWAVGYVDGDDPSDPVRGGVAEPVALTGGTDDALRVVMGTDAFDSFLVLVGPDGSVVGTDDSPAAEASELTATLPSDGEYTVWAGSYSGSATGVYTLAVEQTG